MRAAGGMVVVVAAEIAEGPGVEPPLRADVDRRLSPRRNLDPLAGQGDRPLVEGGVAVAAVGQGVDVRVASDQARG
jgi:hypothetical protein